MHWTEGKAIKDYKMYTSYYTCNTQARIQHMLTASPPLHEVYCRAIEGLTCIRGELITKWRINNKAW